MHDDYASMTDDELRRAIKKLDRRESELMDEQDAAYSERNRRPSMNEEE